MGRAAIGAFGLAALSAATPAHAGAWVASEDGQDILTTTYGQTEDGFYSETDYYWEAPIARRLSVVAQPRYEHGAQHLAGWRADAQIGLKAGLTHASGAAAAVQAGATWRSDPEAGCGEGGAELRTLGGYSRGATRSAFVNAEAAVRLQSGGCLRQRFELTGGFRPNEDWMALAQAFSDVGADGEPILKAQVSVVRFGILGHGLQLGFRSRIDGNEAEPALILGWWGAARR